MQSALAFWLLTALALTLSVSSEAQQATRVPRIGFLTGDSPSNNSERREAFRQGLREHGYMEGKNIVIEWRFTGGKADRRPALAAELVHLNLDVIVAVGSGDIRRSEGSDR